MYYIYRWQTRKQSYGKMVNLPIKIMKYSTALLHLLQEVVMLVCVLVLFVQLMQEVLIQAAQ